MMRGQSFFLASSGVVKIRPASSMTRFSVSDRNALGRWIHLLPIVLGLSVVADCRPTTAEVSGDGAEQSMEVAASNQLLTRFDVRGGLLAPTATNAPRWSLYEDGLVIWTGEGDPTPGFTSKVWTGHMSDNEIRELSDFIEGAGFWDLESVYRPAHEVGPAEKTVRLNPAAALDQPSSTLTVRSGEKVKQVTVYPTQWEGAPSAYLACRERILQTRPQQPREFEPQAFRLEVGTPTPGQLGSGGSAWPFQDIELSEVRELELTRDQGLELSKFLGVHAQVVVYDGEAFSLRLFAEAPR